MKIQKKIISKILNFPCIVINRSKCFKFISIGLLVFLSTVIYSQQPCRIRTTNSLRQLLHENKKLHNYLCRFQKSYKGIINHYSFNKNIIWAHANKKSKNYQWPFAEIENKKIKIRSPYAKMKKPYLWDMLSPQYPHEWLTHRPKTDPGRYRVDSFLRFVYGSGKRQVLRNSTLVRIANQWVLFNKKNDAAKSLEKVSQELERLFKKKPHYKRYFSQRSLRTKLFYQKRIQAWHNYRDWPPTFYWRYIKGTRRLSSHAYAIALDLHPGYASYWRYHRNYRTRKYIRKPPRAIIAIFEKYGFIWGGKWYHYDTMHFEYRPELADKD